MAILMIYLVTGAGGLSMTVLRYRSRLIPRPIAILGLIGYPALLAGGVLDMINLIGVTQGVGLIALVPGGCLRAGPPDLAPCQRRRLPAPQLRTVTSAPEGSTRPTDIAQIEPRLLNPFRRPT